MTSTIATLNRRTTSGGEQARGLRDLVVRRNASLDVHDLDDRGCHSIVITGGKGGVGRSILALNLAILFAQRGDSVGLVDTAPGLGNLELLCGLNGYWNLSHVALGCRELENVIQPGPAGVRIVSGASCLTDPSSGDCRNTERLVEQLHAFESKLDWLIVDGSGGSVNLNREFARSADDLLIVTTPEITAIAEAYASVKSFTANDSARIGLLVNQADSAAQANQILDRLQQSSRSFLQMDLHRRGFIPRDSAIPASVNDRTPLVLQAPQSPAAMELARLAQRWSRRNTVKPSAGYFTRLLHQ